MINREMSESRLPRAEEHVDSPWDIAWRLDQGDGKNS